MKYDELTLMQFVDGELDEALTAEIEGARANDKELQAYLEVYETTRSALIESNQEEAIPSHISDMIDNFSPVKKQNRLANIVKNNPFKSSIFSAILAALVTFQGVLVSTGGMFTATQFAARGFQPTTDISGIIQNVTDEESVFRAASSVNKISKSQIEDEVNKVLSVNQNASQVTIKVGAKISILNFLERFTDTDGNNCKVGQIDDQFLILCKSDDSQWIIKSN
jgi:hypothetical protein